MGKEEIKICYFCKRNKIIPFYKYDINGNLGKKIPIIVFYGNHCKLLYCKIQGKLYATKTTKGAQELEKNLMTFNTSVIDEKTLKNIKDSIKKEFSEKLQKELKKQILKEIKAEKEEDKSDAEESEIEMEAQDE